MRVRPLRPAGRSVGAVARVTPLEVHDHGTGLGGTVAAAVGLGAQRPEDAAGGWPLVTAAAVVVTLGPSPTGAGAVTVTVGHGRPLAVDRRDVATAVVSRLTREVLDAGAHDVHLHAGAAVDPTGRGAVVIGRSGAGKSTLTVQLASRPGWRLVNDEQVAVFPDQARVGGFTRPATVLPDAPAHLPISGIGPDGIVTAAALGTDHVVVGRPGLVVLPDLQRGRTDVAAEVLTPGRAVVEMAANNLDLARQPRRALEAFAWLATTVPTVRLVYGRASDAADAVARMLARPRSRATVPWRVSPAPPGADPTATCRIDPATLTARVGREVVLLHGRTRRVAHLVGPGAEVWHGLCRAATGASATAADPVDDGHLAAAADLVIQLAAAGFLDLT